MPHSFPTRRSSDLLDLLTGKPLQTDACEQLIVKGGTGKLNEVEFDNKVHNLVNFLAYMAEPYKTQSHRIGFWVLFYLLILTTVTYLLKKDFWQHVPKNN
jgi:ubiquinol-cytochrome c reductase cytochrome c1 subunit